VKFDEKCVHWRASSEIKGNPIFVGVDGAIITKY
jgi:hypothetical protein